LADVNKFPHRLATADDIPALRRLMDASIAGLLKAVLSPEQVAASHAIMGLDTQLIADGTYFAVVQDGRLIGSGGWSRRATPFGGDHSAGRDDRLLDPAREPARVRAMYTDPAYARRGIGRMVLGLCERAAAEAGFAQIELTATMGGLPLYRACGYGEIEWLRQDVGGVIVPLLRMGKVLR
jgi:GNAT superfamily N-acetyltransferase